MTCYCGHVEDEHDVNGGACVIEDCPCGFFDWDGEEDGD